VAFRAGANTAEIIEGVDAGAVAVVPLDEQGIVADGLE
jgi:hypothetical protein